MGAVESPRGKAVDGLIVQPMGGKLRDSHDQARLRQSVKRDVGFKVQSSLCPVPLFFNRWGANIWLEDTFRGAPVFLLCGGPSLATKYDLAQLSRPGCVAMGINNSPCTYRPQLWCNVDSTQSFLRSIWQDPRVMKFAPFDHAGDRLFDSATWREMGATVGDCPNVVYYRRNEHFDPAQYLREDTVNWGEHGEHRCALGLKGSRSVMLAATRILFALGFRTIFLVGADFKMTLGAQNYAWKQDRAASSVKHNNETYAILNQRFGALRPKLEEVGCNVFNCNPDSGLTCFDHVPFESAVRFATDRLPPSAWNETRKQWICTERTEGLYDRKAHKDAAEKETKKAAKATTAKGKAEHEAAARIAQEFYDNGPDASRKLAAKLNETGRGAEAPAHAEAAKAADAHSPADAAATAAPRRADADAPARLTPEEIERAVGS